MKKRKNSCVFCRDDFPCDYQLVSAAPEYWILVLNIEPQCDFHCIIVLKASIIDRIGHISHVGDKRLPDEAMIELGLLLNKASIAMKKSDPTIDKILSVSLNTGKTSKHMHVHLIPKRLKEQVKTINNPREDGGGLFFLARKEVILDTFKSFLKSTTGDESNKLITAINNATKDRVKRNAKILKENFEKIWKSDSKRQHGEVRPQHVTRC
jgi:diadenosine tetraphosphate (Ap4A) HIT family hydrolase